MKKNIFMVAVAMLALLATSCNKDFEDLTQTPITISATYDGEGEKVAYTEDGANITATWEAGDELIVCWNNHKNTLTLSSGAGTTSATFTGTITGTPSANSTLVCFVKDSKNPGAVTISDNGDYLYTSDAFLTQDGSMDSAASRNLYYGTCFYGDGTNISCTFSVNTSMMKFTVNDISADAGRTASITYKSGSTSVAKATFTVAAENNTIYLSIPAGRYTGVQSLEYVCGCTDISHLLSATQANFSAGQTYSKAVTFIGPLSFEAKSSNSTVSFTNDRNSVHVNLEYSLNGSDWTTYSDPITLANVGDIVSFRGDNETVNVSEGPYNKFSCTGQCYVYGNIMSILSSTDYYMVTTLTNDYILAGLFSGNTAIFNHPIKTLELPATTLSRGCYTQMFNGCTNLTLAPELPATTLSWHCYNEMFYGCTSLTHAPTTLPAETLSQQCYGSMFYNCTSLTSAPSLPASTLASYCYHAMFRNCTSLSTAPALQATSLADHCYQWMFAGCSNLTTAPDLPATILSDACYLNMFRDCSRLNSIKCLATDISATSCTANWLLNVAANGTFKKASSMTNWASGESGIPSGWTVQNQ